LDHPFKNKPFETEKDLHSLLANKGGGVESDVVNSRLMLERRYSYVMEKFLLWLMY